MLTTESLDKIVSMDREGRSMTEIAIHFGLNVSTISRFLNRLTYMDYWHSKGVVNSGPRILVLDIEIAPCLSYHWGLWNQNIGLNMTVRDWYVMSWAAKWVGEDEVMYEDMRHDHTSEDDSDLLKSIWELIDEADIVVTQNGKKFDMKKLNARFVYNGFKPPSSYKQIDTLVIAKRHFGFTSNKLEYMTDKLCKKYKKLKHAKFSGFELWSECLKGNMEAWEEMEEYNKYDVLSLEELMFILAPWSNQIPNVDMYYDDYENHCLCGSTTWENVGYAYTNVSKFIKWKCSHCGYEKRDRNNLLSKEKRSTLRMNVT